MYALAVSAKKSEFGAMQAIALPVRSRWVNGIFWVLVTIIFLYDRTYLIVKAGLPSFFLCSVIRIGLLVGLAWVNLHLLIPMYLLRKRYGTYFSTTLLLVIAYLLVQSVCDVIMYGFVLGPGFNRRIGDSLAYNFTHTSLYLALTVALKFSIDWYEQNKTLQDVKVQKLQAEVDYLRSQVNPHFLFNALNNLYALTLRKSYQAPDIVLKLSEMMEYMLYESDEAYVPLEKEIRYLRNYLELERIRQGNPADIRLTVTGEPDKCLIPPFLILPLVENAFKHGISRAVHNAYLHIEIRLGSAIEVEVVNNKLDFRAADRSGGIGLANVRRRLELLYPDRHELRIANEADIFRVTLKLEGTC
jgi:hypothetical protein